MRRKSGYKLALTAAGMAGAIWAVATIWAGIPCLNWPDRRPIGALFLGSTAHVSARNPRGWFHNSELNVTGAGGQERFCRALLAYAERSVAVLRSAGAQGMIVWDVEGEEYPHKTTYIGDPRLVSRLAPETTPCLDEFFARFRRAGMRVGVTIRPQQLVFRGNGRPAQQMSWNYAALLRDKIDYSRNRWGATLFYIDSNGGPVWPFEAFHLRRLAASRSDILLVPEYQHPLYYAFSAPYDDARHGDTGTPALIRFFYPRSFKVLNVSQAGRGGEHLIRQARMQGDVVLFNGWFCGTDCMLLQAAS
jgi:hypothetical protein